jgi:hypothetical protein
MQTYTATINSASQLVLALLIYTTLCPIMPRFIISVRVLYDRDLRGCWQGVDTGFGISSQPVSTGNAALSAMEFAAAQEQGQAAEGEVDDSEVIRLEMRDGTHQV